MSPYLHKKQIDNSAHILAEARPRAKTIKYSPPMCSNTTGNGLHFQLDYA